jgi:hypothetical protein
LENGIHPPLAQRYLRLTESENYLGSPPLDFSKTQLKNQWEREKSADFGKTNKQTST